MTTKKQHRWVETVTLSPPSLGDNTADADRLASAFADASGIEAIHIDLETIRRIPFLLRKWNYRATGVLFRNRDGSGELVHLETPESVEALYGVAVDLGTTRIVIRLLDLTNGAYIGETVFDNPQISVGPDILARIHHVEKDEGLDQLQRPLLEGINTELTALCGRCAVNADRIYLAALAGNTAMTHLFLGLNPRWMIREPYIPVVNQPDVLRAKDLGIVLNPNARVLVFPNVGSYFGGDLIAGILFSEMDLADETAILVDVGTNAEVVLGNRNWMMACAGAAGPALEGGVTRIGTMAGPGVIDRVAMDPETLDMEFHTIDECKPRGICGSGVIDLAAALFLSSKVDIRGKLVPDRCGNRFSTKNGLGYLTLVPADQSDTGEALDVTQADLDSLIRSKAAMYTILETITARVGMQPQDLKTFFVAGTFGTYINPASAITIGMIPDIPLSCYHSLGNSSLGGATRVLEDPTYFERISKIRDGITYLELNVNQDFMNRFSAAKFIPHTDKSRFPSVTIPR